MCILTENKNENIHADHRERVRQRFINGGLDSFPDHNVLEFLLFYSIPRKDTNELAHLLLDTFGSLSAVFDAPYEELIKVKGVGDSTATLIRLIPDLFKRYSKDKVENDVYFSEPEKLNEYICSLFIGDTVEKIKLLCFNSTGRLMNCCDVSKGTKNRAGIDNRTLLEAAFRNNASHVILAHNHPLGFANPSRADINMTTSAYNAFNSVGIRLLDHYIVSANGSFSMAAHPKYTELFGYDI